MAIPILSDQIREIHACPFPNLSWIHPSKIVGPNLPLPGPMEDKNLVKNWGGKIWLKIWLGLDFGVGTC